VTLTGATGLIGSKLVARLLEREADVTVLSRDPERARATLGDVTAVRWDLMEEPAPVEALAGRDAVVHLAGEPVAQRWSEERKRTIVDSRVVGTRNLVSALKQCDPRPRTLLSASAVGYYGPHGEEPLDEDAPPGEDFLARVCVDWETEARHAGILDIRTVQIRIGIVLDAKGGALATMLTPFRLGVGGPVAGGRQYMSWIHADDLVGIMLTALTDERWSGPVNATAPEPVTNAEFSSALGRALHRPAVLPIPALALRALYGEMAEIVTAGVRAVPAKALVLGFDFAHADLDLALRSALAG
jgi:uncharacterized protein (TIGR01777 family)